MVSDGNKTAVLLYPREVICAGCGESLFLSWKRIWGEMVGVYGHSNAGSCEFRNKILKPTGIFAGIVEEED
jgi:hypothetical protein